MVEFLSIESFTGSMTGSAVELDSIRNSLEKVVMYWTLIVRMKEAHPLTKVQSYKTLRESSQFSSFATFFSIKEVVCLLQDGIAESLENCNEVVLAEIVHTVYNLAKSFPEELCEVIENITNIFPLK
jgi:hypothetical protein